MKVRMLFAHELVLTDEKEARLLKVDEKHDLETDVATDLIDRGIAEPFPCPVPKAPKAAKDDTK